MKEFSSPENRKQDSQTEGSEGLLPPASINNRGDDLSGWLSGVGKGKAPTPFKHQGNTPWSRFERTPRANGPFLSSKGNVHAPVLAVERNRLEG